MPENYSNAMMLIKSTIRPKVNLPAYVFCEKFTKHLFFDNDICTSDYLINATKTIVGNVFGDDSVASVFSCSDFDYLGDLHMHDDWISKIISLSSKMNEAGDYGGLIIVEQKKRWALFQRTPVDEGVLGLNSVENLESIADLIYDNFVDCDTFRGWLGKGTSRDVNLVENIGEGFLNKINDNYS